MSDRLSVLVWGLIVAYVVVLLSACGYWTYRAVAANPPAPLVCTDSGIIYTPTGAISAAECHRG